MAARRAARTGSSDHRRMVAFGVLILAVWLGLGYRLFLVQVVQAAEYEQQGLDQRLTRKTIAPVRGTMFDRNGNPLAMTVEAVSIYVVPDLVEDPVYTAQQVAAITGSNWEPMYERILKGGQFAYMVRQVEADVAEDVKALGLPELGFLPEPRRMYPDGPIAGAVVGMVRLDGSDLAEGERFGLEGLEYAYDEVLGGRPGELVFESDVKGVPIPQAQRTVVPAVPGDDLVTTIDLSLQYRAYETCLNTIEVTQASSCWAVVLNAETGEVLAMAGSPGFDPETRQSLADGGAFDNFVIRGTYEPGSTQKLITFAAALESGTVRVDDVIPRVADRYEVTPGACESNSDDIHGCYGDFSPHETRDMSVAEIFTISSNVGTIRLEERLPDGVLESYLERFGLGRPTGIDFTGEAAGSINVPAGCSSCEASVSIGYSVAVTPLQMAAAYAAIANDGVWTQPHLVASRVDVDGRSIPVEPERRQVVSEGTAWTMRQLLARVVGQGTGTKAQVAGYRVGGKTGTADKIVDGVYVEETIASFVGMAPIDDPKIVVAVVVDGPAFEYRTGGAAAAPAFAEIMEAALHSLGVPPDATG
jgi:cell division protein FtsI (penicillin-binding protein 3)